MTAQDGLDALNQLAVPLPDVIISDLRMPRMSGFEFLAVVRRKYPDVPLIAISGEFEGNKVPPGVPADAYLPKGSYTLDQLRTKITDLLSAPPRAGIGRADEALVSEIPEEEKKAPTMSGGTGDGMY